MLVRGAVAYLIAMEGKLFGATNSRNVCELIRSGLDDLNEDEWMRGLRSAGKS